MALVPRQFQVNNAGNTVGFTFPRRIKHKGHSAHDPGDEPSPRAYQGPVSDWPGLPDNTQRDIGWHLNFSANHVVAFAVINRKAPPCGAASLLLHYCGVSVTGPVVEHVGRCWI